MAELNIPRPWRKPFHKDGDPVFFAVLEAAWRHPEAKAMPLGAPNRYHECHPDEPLANEFRAYFHQEWGMCSIPLGSERERAERFVHALNEAFNFGLVHAGRRFEDPRTKPVLVGLRGHRGERGADPSANAGEVDHA